ncbi:MFS transporter [Spirillospora sp. CA-108201]
MLYYLLYIQYAVATSIMSHYGMSFGFFILLSVVGNAIGAFASLLAGLADRWGRANLVVYGLLVAGLLVLGLPHAPDKNTFLALFALLSFIEGIVLVATPALIRDFSPQLGRATAMGIWTMGPVLGSLVVTTVTSATLDTSGRQDELRYAGFAAPAVFVVALFGRREPSPALRDQIMVSLRDRALVEARQGHRPRPAGVRPLAADDAAGRRRLRLRDQRPPAALLRGRRQLRHTSRSACSAAWPTRRGWRASPRPPNGTTRRPPPPASRCGDGSCGSSWRARRRSSRWW